jgi:hypothetical protein
MVSTMRSPSHSRRNIAQTTRTDDITASSSPDAIVIVYCPALCSQAARSC